MLSASANDPFGFNLRFVDVKCRGSVPNTIISAGDLVYFDFINGTNDHDRTGETVTPSVNGFQAVTRYDAAVHNARPGVYGIALEPITTDAANTPTSIGRVRIQGVVTATASASVAKGDVIRPSTTAGRVMAKPVASGTGADSAVVLGVALTAGSTPSILLDGFAFNGARIP